MLISFVVWQAVRQLSELGVHMERSHRAHRQDAAMLPCRKALDDSAATPCTPAAGTPAPTLVRHLTFGGSCG